VRCFLAVPLREPGLAVAQRTLQRLQRDIADVRWTRPETLHITVHFFGWIDDDRVRQGVDAVRPIVVETSPFTLTLDRLGQFPDRGRPRVLWLGGSKASDELTALAVATREALGSAGFAVEERPFRAHCTLGRTRDTWTLEARDRWHAVCQEPMDAAAFTADCLVLYESVTGRGGAIYMERVALPFVAR